MKFINFSLSRYRQFFIRLRYFSRTVLLKYIALYKQSYDVIWYRYFMLYRFIDSSITDKPPNFDVPAFTVKERITFVGFTRRHVGTIRNIIDLRSRAISIAKVDSIFAFRRKSNLISNSHTIPRLYDNLLQHFL